MSGKKSNPHHIGEDGKYDFRTPLSILPSDFHPLPGEELQSTSTTSSTTADYPSPNMSFQSSRLSSPATSLAAYSPSGTQSVSPGAVGGRWENSGSRLELIRQPGHTHRARYMSEGSRGAIKDETGLSYCVLKLHGAYSGPVKVEMYAGTTTDPVRPHPFYALIPVMPRSNSQATKCTEVIAADGLNCLQIILEPAADMCAILDCIGVLKLCSEESRRKRGKSATDASIRLVFRTTVLSPESHSPAQQVRAVKSATVERIQLFSQNIYCGQLLGRPEIRRVSTTTGSVNGGTEIFIVGRNFDKSTKIIFQEYDNDGTVVWSSEAEILKEYTGQCHMVLVAPPYKEKNTQRRVNVSITADCASKLSDQINFTYTPNQDSETRSDNSTNRILLPSPTVTSAPVGSRFPSVESWALENFRISTPVSFPSTLGESTSFQGNQITPGVPEPSSRSSHQSQSSLSQFSESHYRTGGPQHHRVKVESSRDFTFSSCSGKPPRKRMSISPEYKHECYCKGQPTYFLSHLPESYHQQCSMPSPTNASYPEHSYMNNYWHENTTSWQPSLTPPLVNGTVAYSSVNQGEIGPTNNHNWSNNNVFDVSEGGGEGDYLDTRGLLCSNDINLSPMGTSSNISSPCCSDMTSSDGTAFSESQNVEFAGDFKM